MDATVLAADAGLRPRDEADIVEILKGRTSPLSVEGHGSKRGLGRPGAEEVLSLAELDGIVAYEPAELVLTARAATPLADVQALLARNRQHLAFEPPDWAPLYGAPKGDAPAGTLGGIIACNLSGSRRVTAGAPRDHFLGFRAVNGRGEAFKAGGRVVKNVTGYDLPKLLAGSFGTLAVLTEVTLKVLPLPESRITLVWRGLDDHAGVACLIAALGSRHEVGAGAHLPASAARTLGRGAEAATLVRIEGPAPSTEARAAMLTSEMATCGPAEPLAPAEADALWRAMGGGAAFAGAVGADAVWRVSVPPSHGPAFVADLPMRPALYWYDWGGGLVWLGYSGDDVETVRAAARRAGGHAMLVRGSEELRARAGLYGPQAPGLAALTRRIKASFDPRGLLGPGRMREPAPSHENH